MSAVIEGTTQKEMFDKVIQLLKNKLKKKDIDHWSEEIYSGEVSKGWETVEIVFRPKETDV